MWATPLTRTDSRPQPNPWHQDDGMEAAEAQAAGEGASGSGSGSSEPDVDRSGTWGERDVGDVHEDGALQEYEALRNDLIQLHKTRTKDTQASKLSISRTRSHATAKRRFSSAQDDAKDEDGIQVEGAEDEDESEAEFELGEFMREGHFEKRTEAGSSAKKLGLVYEHLTVKGVGSTASLVRTVPDAILGTFGPDLYHLLCRVFPSLRFRKPPTRALIHDFIGCVRDGEMMLVLGRPGSGCSTFLKAVSNNRDSFAAVEGDVSYGGITAETQKKLYRGEVTYNDEDDVHFASLSVWKTLTFALMNKTKRSAKEEIPIIASALLRMFGISHTKNTLIGDDYIRGVSGGERKRVSIAETLASKSAVIAWDNSTRGLDASTALDYARSLRIMTDISNRTTLVTLYQAGEGIYEVMDKVLVIDQGRQIFCGPASEAKQYFVDLGFECPERQTTADFLTAVTDPNERRFRSGFEHRAPRTAEDLEKAFRASPNYERLLADVAEYKQHLHRTEYADAREFEGAVRESKSRNVRKKSPYTVSFPRQVWACSQREFWLLFGDKTALWTKLFIVISNGLIVGSLFHGQPLDTAGAFTRGGTAFFSIVFLGWLQMSELSKAVSGRAVVARHDDYAFYRPSAVSVARVVQDFPVVAVQVAIFGLTMYFMTGLAVEAGRFWIYMLYVYTTTMMLTAMYRMFAALSPEIDTAVRFSGIALNLLAIYTGYVLPKTQLLTDYIWFGWLYWVNPISYAFEAVMANEFSGRVMECSPSMLVPQGPGVLPDYQGCALSGAAVNSRTVSGDDYLQTAYSYTRANLWRNFGVLIAFAVLYIGVTAVATELVSFREGGGGALIFKKTRKAKEQKRKAAAPADEEKAVGNGGGVESSESSTTMGGNGNGNGNGNGSGHGHPQPAGEEGTQEKEETMEKLAKSDSVFTWRNVEYTVPYMGGERRLLNKVNGYAKPGIMVALMGASGAGKTTLLNTLSQRQKTGVVTGDMFVDGSALGPDFQRNTGFCLQGDIHDKTQTVREAIEFSALLRQEATVPRAEKLAYVGRIIDLLELGDLQDAVIKSLGVEQRKRLTIGVELAAKPSLLLFLDEPTSGLDSQSAYSIVRFLKKLSRAGQAIVCTIHQPSSVLIQEFDMVLALNPGGNTFYFGPIGENGRDVIEYFADRGAVCPPAKNVAEFILETAARPHRRPDGSKVDWNEEWLRSEQARRVVEEIDRVSQRQALTKTATEQERKQQHREYAAPAWLQTVELTKRVFRQQWRDPSYVYGKLFVAVIMGIFNGFTFWQLGSTVQDMQNRMFTCFMIVTIPPTIVNAVVPKFDDNLALWQAREYPARIYGWAALCTANILAEVPTAVVSAFLYWVLWYWATGLPTESAASGYTFLMSVLVYLFMSSWGQWICAFAPSFTVISNVLPFFFVMFGLFNGVVRPYSTLPAFWKYWVYYLNPATYWIGGMLSATLSGQPVECARGTETARFRAPPGQTCAGYAGVFADAAGGYLLNPDGNGTDVVCEYCPYQSGDQYLQTLNIRADEKWRNFGIFLAFCVSNWTLVYFFVYTVRVRGWKFGFDRLFGGLGKALDLFVVKKKESPKSTATTTKATGKEARK